ncbi:3669_t:CDS:2 [Diversispora eburnea]|uniref:3669_t:CDS:1 n=1 Tax=Diversispora eburnea TaxID=1213867 RepID=A0A9N9B2A1_9GLOM|nr:3669_t:CDS:2 [Diversispora eburnea]
MSLPRRNTKWKQLEIIEFLRNRKEDLDLEEDIQIIKDNRLPVLHSFDYLKNNLKLHHIISLNLLDGPTGAIAGLIRKIKNKEEIWYIVDGKIPAKVETKPILVSPKKDYYRNFDKYIGAIIRFMPQILIEKTIVKSNARLLDFVGEINHDDTVWLSDKDILDIKEYPKLIFNEIEEIEDGKYYKPIQKNFKSVDAVVALNILFHPIKMKSLLAS